MSGASSGASCSYGVQKQWSFRGLVLGQISQSLFTIIALTTVLTMILTPILSSESVLWRLIRLHPLRTRGRPKRIPRNHVLLLGGSKTVMPLLETLHLSGEQVLVVDEDPGIVSQLRDEDIACMRGGVGDAEVLKAAGALQPASLYRRSQDLAACVRFLSWPGMFLCSSVCLKKTKRSR